MLTPSNSIVRHKAEMAIGIAQMNQNLSLQRVIVPEIMPRENPQTPITIIQVQKVFNPDSFSSEQPGSVSCYQNGQPQRSGSTPLVKRHPTYLCRDGMRVSTLADVPAAHAP